VRPGPALILILLAQLLGVGLSQAQSSNVIGSWRVDIAFENGGGRSLRFEARESGNGSFRVLDPKLKAWGPAVPSEAKWTQSADGSVTFSGLVEFLIGNIGRDAGTLVLKGKFGNGDAIAGAATFFPTDQSPNDPKATPSKSGTFKATRITGG
jgi:hypothetical protein